MVHSLMKALLRLGFSIYNIPMRFRVTSHKIAAEETPKSQHMVAATDLQSPHGSEQITETNFAPSNNSLM